MIISYRTLLPIDNPHAVAVDIGIAINPILARDSVIELDVVAKITKVSIDFSTVVIVLFFFIFLFLFMILFFEVSNHFFKVIN